MAPRLPRGKEPGGQELSRPALPTRCDARAACHGACRGIAYAWTGRLDASVAVLVPPLQPASNKDSGRLEALSVRSTNIPP